MIRHCRRSIRLKDYDYSQSGAYFITVRTQDNQHEFGDIVNGKMKLNVCGHIAKDEWLKTVELRPNVALDAFIIMPNHMHGIVIIKRRGVLQYAPTDPIAFRSPSQTVGAIIRGFKSTVTLRINRIRKTPYARVWQRNYWDHVIRDEDDLNQKRQYIIDNPLTWHLDRYYSER